MFEKDMLRNSILTLVLFGYCFSAHAATNLLIVTVDDMSCDSVGVYGCKLPNTSPNMDRLAAQSLRFKYAHVQVGNCMPSRNVMWSGKYPHNNGVEGFYQVKQPTYPVLCDLAQKAGYYTAIRHKVSHSTPYSPYAWDQDLDTAPDGSAAHTKDPVSYGVSTTQGIEAAKAAGKPFCLVINIADPHKPFYSEVKNGKDPHVPTAIFTADEVPVPGFLPDDPIIRAEVARYYSSVRRADDGLGEILDALKKSGAEKDTVILFLSDHGMPLPFAKTQLYHHSTRTPLMIHWPGVTKPNTLDEQHLVSAVDILPTLLEILGQPLPKNLDGRSLAPLCRGETQSGRDYVVKEYNENSGGKRNPMRAIETREYLYIFNPWSDGKLPMATATNGTDTYRRMKALAATDKNVATRLELADHRVLEELYDVASDPDCLQNLIDAPEHQDAAKHLRQQLTEWMEQTRDPMMEVFRKRESSEFRASYMKQVQGEADQRKLGKGKNRKKAAVKTE